LSALGHAEEGVTLIADALANYRTTGAAVTLPVFFALLGAALGKANRAAEGLKQLEEAERQIEGTEERFGEGRAHRVRGELQVAVGDVVAGEKSLYRAIEVARRQSAKLFELPAAISLARLWSNQGKRKEARDLLTPIYDWFTEGFDAPILKEAKTLLDQLS
jgi:predicted ATPase